MKRILPILLYIILCLSFAVYANTTNQKSPVNDIPTGTTVEETIEELIITPADDIPKENDKTLIIETAAIEEIASERQLESLGSFKITYYCSCSKCNGKWGAIDGFGNPLVWGTVATDKRVIPMHTQLVIEGYEDTVFVARDTGGGVKGNHIDIFVPVSHKEALHMPQGQRLQVWKIVG